MREDADKLLAIIGDLHEGVADGERWRRAFGGLGDLLNDDPPLFLASGIGGSPNFVIEVPRPHVPPEMMAQVNGRLGNAADNPWIDAAKTVPLRRMMGIGDIGRTTLHESRMWRELCVPMGITDMAGAVLERQPHGADAIMLARRAGTFGHGDVSLLNLLLPHLARAWRVRRQLAEWEALARALTAVLDRIERGIVIADDAGRVRFANRAADRMLSEGDGVDVTHGRLRADRPPETEALRSLIRRAAHTGAGADATAVDAMALPRPSGRPGIAVVAEPLAPAHGDRLGQMAVPGAILFLSDGGVHALPQPARLRVVYGLTQAEAGVAVKAVAGSSVAASAVALGVSQNTVKAHLKAVYEKVGVSRQVQLVRRVLADLGGLEPDAGRGLEAIGSAPRQHRGGEDGLG